jgi:hypothetical protein
MEQNHMIAGIKKINNFKIPALVRWTGGICIFFVLASSTLI